VIPLFPQYASATTGSVIEKVMEELKSWLIYPKISFIDAFFDHPMVVDAYAEQARGFEVGNYDKVLFSFHGLPVRQLQKGSAACKKESACCQKNLTCYAAQCFKMADLIAERLKLSPSQKEVVFQSRLGNEPWTEPYTSATLHRLAREGHKKVLVLCPAFVADCLETLYEIGVEYAEEFKAAGGEKLELVPSLNSSKTWVSALKTLITDQTSRSLPDGSCKTYEEPGFRHP
jgi:ferrochelatase